MWAMFQAYFCRQEQKNEERTALTIAICTSSSWLTEKVSNNESRGKPASAMNTANKRKRKESRRNTAKRESRGNRHTSLSLLPRSTPSPISDFCELGDGGALPMLLLPMLLLPTLPSASDSCSLSSSDDSGPLCDTGLSDRGLRIGDVHRSDGI